MTCIRCTHTAKKFGTYGKRHIQRYRCTSCRTTFSDPSLKLGTHYTDPQVAAKALAMMLEGMSVRAAEIASWIWDDLKCPAEFPILKSDNFRP